MNVGRISSEQGRDQILTDLRETHGLQRKNMVYKEPLLNMKLRETVMLKQFSIGAARTQCLHY